MKLSDELACVELVEIITDYLEGALTPRDRERFEEHVAFCDGCANYLDQMRTTIALTGRLTEDDLTPETKRDLLEAFRGWRRG